MKLSSLTRAQFVVVENILDLSAQALRLRVTFIYCVNLLFVRFVFRQCSSSDVIAHWTLCLSGGLPVILHKIIILSHRSSILFFFCAQSGPMLFVAILLFIMRFHFWHCICPKYSWDFPWFYVQKANDVYSNNWTLRGMLLKLLILPKCL